VVVSKAERTTVGVDALDEVAGVIVGTGKDSSNLFRPRSEQDELENPAYLIMPNADRPSSRIDDSLQVPFSGILKADR